MNFTLPNFQNIKKMKKGGVYMFNKSLRKDAKGFTLIELLIVIVIIGILAGVLVAVINPAAQQNRARDATVQAGLNKMALAVGSFNAAYGRLPSTTEFGGIIDGETAAPTCALAAGVVTCTYTMTSIPLPTVNCSANQNCCAASPNNFVGNGDAAGDETPCVFRYSGDTATGRFRIWGKSYGISNGTFLYDSTDGGQIKQCDNLNATTTC